MTRIYIVSLLFFIFSVVSYIVIEWHQNSNQVSNAIDNKVSPDFIAESLNSETYNNTGQLSYIIDANRMEHYSELAVTHFEFPKYTLYPKNTDSPWKISANEGTLYNSNRVKLESKVALIATDSESLIQEIHGKYLELDLNTNIISSEKKIEIKGIDFTMHGTGLIVDLNTKQVTLTKHEKTIFQPTKN
ncbi:LPS export ABC transporter periplasmic protein LptC [Colwellia sp. 1_MG-2023]|uniref:LPS export ABC transporter periplasmic protein LptC n=1 Tax=Colwellia sp. 1_MG-2023 TaxID=3062649 RepID=UPI0026E35C26|nr:LPS export ABC transporter periplasmic protein LptC [Colwellia sp. 1_MG-2023]MDO6444789.1 LPS export ABC transporter periplasmic protein LptC [Colwellia sp. 1_MG-2023]